MMTTTHCEQAAHVKKCLHFALKAASIRSSGSAAYNGERQRHHLTPALGPRERTTGGGAQTKLRGVGRFCQAEGVQ